MLRNLFREIGRVQRNLPLVYPLLKRISESPKDFLRGIKRFALHDDPGQSATDIAPEIARAAKGELPGINPLNFQLDPSLERTPTLNVVLPGWATHRMSGGPNTVINLAYRMAKKGVPVRFISASSQAEADPEPMWKHIQSLTGIHERFGHVTAVCGHDRSKPVFIGKNDAFMATAWWTAQMVNRGLELTRSKKFIYIIQDFEPGFYVWSTEYAMALETYGMNYFAIVNSQLLADYFVENKIGRFAEENFSGSCEVLPMAVEKSRFHYAAKPAAGTRKKRLVFYWRPTSARRNLFELGLAALSRAGELGIFNASDWELCLMGEQTGPVDIHGGITVSCLPWMSYDEYAQMLRETDIVLSLMLSPHSSYPPLEAAASGAIAVTNTYACKTAARLHEISRNIIAIEPTLSSVVEGLREAVKAVEDRESRKAFSEVNLPSTWDAAFEKVLPRAMEMWRECHTKPGSKKALRKVSTDAPTPVVASRSCDS